MNLAYRQQCIDAVGRDLTPGVKWMFWPFPFDSEETREIWETMVKIEIDLFRKYLAQIKTLNIPGAIVELGVV